MNLVIGSTSQLSYYFPKENFKFISSRNILYNEKQNYDKIFLNFAEQRTFLNDTKIFDEINVDYTTEIINYYHKYCDKLIYYSTSELWNNYDKTISLNDTFNYNYTPYIESKRKMTERILSNKWKNVLIVFPFNFNSIYRKPEFLFYKIFNSILNKTKIEIGNVDFYRDIIHPKFVVQESLNINEHKIIGSGYLTNIKQFIIDLYNYYNMNYNEYVIENSEYNLKNKRNNYYYYIQSYPYLNLLKDTIDDINSVSKKYN